MHKTLPLLLLVVLSAAGCLGGGTPPALDAPEAPVAADLTFMDAVRVGERGQGYEPGTIVAPDGTWIVFAHKASVAADGTRLASHMFYSRDTGTTWARMPAPADVRDGMPAFEGSGAFDDEGRLHFLDNYLMDNALTTWTFDDGPVWQRTLPASVTLGQDDRPWLDAFGDGQLYLLSKTPFGVGRTSMEREEDVTAMVRFHRSTDGGLTWTPTYEFPSSSWCHLGHDPRDGMTVYVGCVDGFVVEKLLGTGPHPHTVSLYRSTDGGVTWARAEVHVALDDFGDRFPSLTVSPDGAVDFFWVEPPAEDGPDAVGWAHSDDGVTWNTTLLHPVNGSVQRVWASTAPDGTLDLVFYGRELGGWRPYLMRLDDDPEAVALTEEPVSSEENSPADFFQVAHGPDGAVHVCYGVFLSATPGVAGIEYRNDLMCTRGT